MASQASLRLVVADHRQPPKKLTDEQVRRRLKSYGVRIRKARLSIVEREDIGKDVVFVPRSGEPLLILPVSQPFTRLAGITTNRVAPIRFTAMKAAGITIDTLFARRILDALVVEYCREEIGILVHAGQFLERFR